MKRFTATYLHSALFACVGLSISVLLSGCNPEDARNIAQDTGKIAKDAGKAAGNAQLNDRVYATLVQRKGVDVSGLHLDTQGGVITISGHVHDANEKKIVKETVEGIRGVDKADVSKLQTHK